MLLGRSAELGLVEQLVEDVRAGTGRPLLVMGPPGIGKTALLEHAVGQAGPGMRVLRVAGVEEEAEMPYSALHLLLRPVLDRVDELPGPQAAALRGAFGMASHDAVDPLPTGFAVLTLLSGLAAERPLLCLVDDGHCVDTATAEAVRFVARRIADEPIGILFATREDERTSGLPRLHLKGLAPDAAEALLGRAAPHLPGHRREPILATADGNPLALLELPKFVGEVDALGLVPITDRLRHVFGERIDRLGEAARTLLVIAAAEGTGDLGTVLRAAEELAVPASALAEAERDLLIEFTGGEVRFRHPLVRAAAYQGATFVQRRAVHRILARLLEDREPHRWAWHLAASAVAPDERAAEALERTADGAVRRNGQAAAIAVYERAARLGAEGGRPRRLASAAVAAMEAGRLERAEEFCVAAERSACGPAELVRLAGVRARLELERGDPPTAARLLIDAAAKVSGEKPAEAARLLVEAVYYAGHGDNVPLAGEAVALLDGLGLPRDHPFQPYIRQVRGFYRIITGRAVDEAMFAALSPSTASERSWTARVLNVTGHAAAALEVATDMIAATRADGRLGHLADALFHKACALTSLGRYRAAADTAEPALTIATETGQNSAAAYLRGLLAWLAALAGDDEQCRVLAGEAIRYADDHGTPPSAADATWALALLDLGHGRYESAFVRMENRWPFWPCCSAWIRSTADHLEAAVRAGLPVIGARLLAELERHAERLPDPCAATILDRCRALAGPADKVEPHFLAALCPGDDRPYERARTLLAYGEWLRREHRKADARLRLRAALEIFERTGATLWACRAREELRATGDRSAGAPRPLGIAARLTPQELRVVRLAATGATNRDIGAELFLSPRTVAQHLYRAFPKLGVATRMELASLDLDAD